MNTYVTLDQLKEYIRNPQQQHVSSQDDNRLIQFCVEASRSFDRFCTNGAARPRRFYPTLKQKFFDHQSGPEFPSLDILMLREDILEVSELTTANGATLIDQGDYFLTLYPSGREGPPFNAIQLSENGITSQFSVDTSKIRANSVTGVWGWHDSWDEAWVDTMDTLQSDIAADDTEIEMSNVAGMNADGLSPRIHTLHLIKVNNEYMGVLSVNPTTNIITVKRGMNGTTAATHSSGDTIYTYKPPADIVLALKTLTKYLYMRKDTIGTPDERPLAAAQGLLVMPPVIPNEVQEILRSLKKMSL